VDEVRQSIGADSLGYLSEDGMIAATDQPRERLCTACFTGVYPIELPDAHHLGKNLLERPEGRAETVAATDTGAGPTSDGCEPGPDSEYERLIAYGDPGRQE
jgi:amidophosphoribosyltransferase